MSTALLPALDPIASDAPLQEALQRAQASAALPALAAFAAALLQVPLPPAPAADNPAWPAQGALDAATPGRWSVWAAGLYLQAQFAPKHLNPLLQDTRHAAATGTRLGRTLDSCALLRQALVQTLAQARTPQDRSTQPLLGSVLVDMALESEAALALAMRLAQAFERCDDAASASPPALERAWQQVMAPAAQFWIGRRAMEITGETMEWAGAQGALGSAQGQALARLFLAAPAQGRGEGTGNALCLEVLQALAREGAASCVLFQALEDMAGEQPHILAQLHALRAMLAQPPAQQQALARMLVQRLVLTAQACLLRHDAPPTVAQAFITSRLTQTGAGRVLGAIDTRHMDVDPLLQRALPR